LTGLINFNKKIACQKIILFRICTCFVAQKFQEIILSKLGKQKSGNLIDKFLSNIKMFIKIELLAENRNFGRT